jgi:hypothetical protein
MRARHVARQERAIAFLHCIGVQFTAAGPTTLRGVGAKLKDALVTLEDSDDSVSARCTAILKRIVGRFTRGKPQPHDRPYKLASCRRTCGKRGIADCNLIHLDCTATLWRGKALLNPAPLPQEQDQYNKRDRDSDEPEKNRHDVFLSWLSGAGRRAAPGPVAKSTALGGGKTCAERPDQQ